MLSLSHLARIAAVFAGLLCLAGCDHSAPGLPVVSIPIGSRSYSIEVARSEEEKQTGLMKRDSMPDNHGMIFIFPDEAPRGFWMKNTRFPLDILFLNSSFRVVSIHTMFPYDETVIPSDFPAQYAIELNKGEAAAAGVKVGDTIAVPQSAR